MNEEDKKNIIDVKLIMGICVFVVLLIGTSYAYFQTQGNKSARADVTITTYTTDVLTFKVGDAINIYADQVSFGQNKTSLNGTTTATATLTANNDTNDTTMNYYVYLNITSNTFKYTQNENTPELILTITGPDGELTSLDGYTYKTVTDIKGTSISGFDVTTANGLITIANNKAITAGTKSTVAKETNVEDWTITLTFVNYDADQTANAGKSMNADVIIRKKIIPSAAYICKNGQSLSSCIVALSDYDDTLYYHDSSLINGAGDNSYRYAGAGGHPAYYSCTYDGNTVINYASKQEYMLKGECSDVYKWIGIDQYGEHIVYYTNLSEENVSNFSVNGNYTSSTISKVDMGIETLVSSAEDGVSNYVCFGSDAETCPAANLYRIIGVIDGKVKLIKATSLGDMVWDSNNSNTWSTSSLNTYLNGTYLNTFSEDWQSKIATTTWKVGGISSSSVTAATMYTNEMNSTSSGTDGLTEYSSKIALMYAHDYGFAASPTAWTTTLYNYDGNDSTGTSITTNDWLYLGSYEWIVSRDSSNSTISYRVNSSGRVGYNRVAYSHLVRPVLFLESTATYSSGVGTSDNPYRLG